MIEVGLVLVIFALCALVAWLDWNNRKERSKLVNAIVAKTPEQLRDLEFVEKVQPAKIAEQLKQDFTPVEAMNDEEFETYIEEQNAKQ